jgi:hypothetical protein
MTLFPPVIWPYLPWMRRYVGENIRPLSPPVLIVSMPRSGSSWVGDVLGLSPKALYLREPITQTYLHSKESNGPRLSVFEVDSADPPKCYSQAADLAFAGIPAFGASIVTTPRQWSPFSRRIKRLVIKEVNPLALTWLIERYRPRVVYLLRHPAAVASSFQRMGWTMGALQQRLQSDTTTVPSTGSFWADQGSLQAIVLRRALHCLRSYPDFQIVQYEDLCTDPLKVFKDLYDFSGLSWSDEIARNIDSMSHAESSKDSGEYGLHRDSRSMIEKWRSAVSEHDLAEIRQTYLLNKPEYYREHDW